MSFRQRKPLACIFAISVFIFSALPIATYAAGTIELTPKIEPGQTVRVTIEFEAGGNQLVRIIEDAKAAPKGEEKQLPASVVANLQYDERRLAPREGRFQPGTPLAVRYYDRAEETIKVDQGGIAPRLADTRRLIVVEQGSEARPNLYSPAGPLPREELDLIDLVGNSTLLEQLLPTKPVGKNDTWSTDAAVMGAWLTFDTVSVCEVQSILEEFNDAFAKVRLAGVVHGTADGTPTQQEVRVVYLFDRRAGRIARANVAVREQRSIGGATPGLDAVAKMQMKVEPIATSSRLTDEVVASARRAKRPASDVLLEAPGLGFRMIHDRQWYITSRDREQMTLRRIDHGDFITQCTITSLPPKSAGRQTSLEQFQRDIIYSLGQSFGEMVSTRQWQNARGHYCYAVVVRGFVEEVPIQWHYYLVAQESGHRITLAVTTAGQMVDRLGQADRALVEAMELFQPVPTGSTTAQATTKTTK
jgi:hypothetical protein